MIEKLKEWGLAAKNFLLWIVLPITSIVGFIAYLLSSKTKVETKLAEVLAEKELSKQIAEGMEVYEQTKQVAENAKDHYVNIRNEYLKQQSNKSGSTTNE